MRLQRRLGAQPVLAFHIALVVSQQYRRAGRMTGFLKNAVHVFDRIASARQAVYACRIPNLRINNKNTQQKHCHGHSEGDKCLAH
ncbi:hypothetical protein D3C80_1034700 [compost metagenome]